MLMIVMSLTTLIAESAKLAYVNVEQIMAESKDVQEAKRIFDAESAEWRTEIETMQTELEELAGQFEKKKLILNEQGKKDAAQKIKAKEDEVNRKINEYFGQQGLAASRNAELLEPILDRINKVIEEVSIDENYDMVLDITAGNVLYAKENLDITEVVLSRLNTGDFSSSDSDSGKN
jgi:outer membrane protein